jgi:5-methylcytosine-specific restriction enzyme subunit McrC
MVIMQAPLILTEGAPAVSVPLTGNEFRILSELGFVTVMPTLDAGIFNVVAGRKVGAVSLGDWQVIVRPKITDLNRLLFLLGYARNPSVWRNDPVQLDPADDLLSAVAESFARLASRAVEQGVLQGYRTVREHLPVIRGRILAGEQMNRLYGLPVPVAVEYDDFTSDIPENQLLATATLRLLSVPRVGDQARRSLLRLRRTFADISVISRGAVLPGWQLTRLNARYEVALRLAEIILAAESFDHRVGELTATGYMFDMWRIFEDFVTTAVSESLAGLGWRCETQAALHLDERRQVDMRPDLLCRRGLSKAVVDAKYKAERPDGFPNADLYQMLAYCTVLDVSEGHLVYAKGNELKTTHEVRQVGTRIHCHALDLGLEPAALLDQVDELAMSVINATVNPLLGSTPAVSSLISSL